MQGDGGGGGCAHLHRQWRVGQTTTKVPVWVWPLTFNPWTYVAKLYQRILLGCNWLLDNYTTSPHPCSKCAHLHTHTSQATHMHLLTKPHVSSNTLTLTLTPSHTHPHTLTHSPSQGSHVHYQVSLHMARLFLWDSSTSVAPRWGSAAGEATDWWAPVDVPARLMEHGAAVSQPANFSRHNVCTCLYAASPWCCKTVLSMFGVGIFSFAILQMCQV